MSKESAKNIKSSDGKQSYINKKSDNLDNPSTKSRKSRDKAFENIAQGAEKSALSLVIVVADSAGVPCKFVCTALHM